jgi:hypothetical protein
MMEGCKEAEEKGKSRFSSQKPLGGAEVSSQKTLGGAEVSSQKTLGGAEVSSQKTLGGAEVLASLGMTNRDGVTSCKTLGCRGGIPSPGFL